MWRRISFIFVEPDSIKVLAYKKTYNGCRHSFGEGIYKSFLSTFFISSVFFSTPDSTYACGRGLPSPSESLTLLKTSPVKQTHNGYRHSIGEGTYKSSASTSSYSSAFSHQTLRTHVAEDFLHLRRA